MREAARWSAVLLLSSSADADNLLCSRLPLHLSLFDGGSIICQSPRRVPASCQLFAERLLASKYAVALAVVAAATS